MNENQDEGNSRQLQVHLKIFDQNLFWSFCFNAIVIIELCMHVDVNVHIYAIDWLIDWFSWPVNLSRLI